MTTEITVLLLLALSRPRLAWSPSLLLTRRVIPSLGAAMSNDNNDNTSLAADLQPITTSLKGLRDRQAAPHNY